MEEEGTPIPSDTDQLFLLVFSQGPDSPCEDAMGAESRKEPKTTQTCQGNGHGASRIEGTFPLGLSHSEFTEKLVSSLPSFLPCIPFIHSQPEWNSHQSSSLTPACGRQTQDRAATLALTAQSLRISQGRDSKQS